MFVICLLFLLLCYGGVLALVWQLFNLEFLGFCALDVFSACDLFDGCLGMIWLLTVGCYRLIVRLIVLFVYIDVLFWIY